MVDWKNIGVPIIIAVIAGAVALVSALINYIIAALFVPNFAVSTTYQTLPEKPPVFEITNTGSAAAKGLKLTVEAPLGYAFKEPTFSTENYTYKYDPPSPPNTPPPPELARLDIYSPRFVHGAGSMMKIEALSASDIRSSASTDFVFSFTYDQGSIRLSVPSVAPKAPEAPEYLENFWRQYQTAIFYATLGIAAIITGVIINNVVRKRPKVIAVSPPDGSTNVSVDSLITATFDEQIDRSTINRNTFLVINDRNYAIIDSSIFSPDGKTVVFKPRFDLEHDVRYRAVISSDVKGRNGRSMGSDKMWSFTTIG